MVKITVRASSWLVDRTTRYIDYTGRNAIINSRDIKYSLWDLKFKFLEIIIGECVTLNVYWNLTHDLSMLPPLNRIDDTCVVTFVNFRYELLSTVCDRIISSVSYYKR